ncbi:MAG: hypothetical protein KDJ97_38870 [Anaerolineae bacterium]|nr:hypothetical protein [Anaerolineae bacterium]
MNKLESEYAQRLEALKACGEIIWWSFESVKLRLADNTFYTPDFFVQRVDGSFEVHETKGFMRDDANVKLKVANEFFPWTFYLVRKEVGGFGWDIRKIGNKDF